MKLVGNSLQANQRHQRHDKEGGAGEVTPLKRHSDGIATGFA